MSRIEVLGDEPRPYSRQPAQYFFAYVIDEGYVRYVYDHRGWEIAPGHKRPDLIGRVGCNAALDPYSEVLRGITKLNTKHDPDLHHRAVQQADLRRPEPSVADRKCFSTLRNPALFSTAIPELAASFRVELLH